MGEFISWPIVGSVVSPNWLSEEERRKEVAALNTSFDDLPLKIPLLHSWVYPEQEVNGTPVAVPTIIFFHCEAGSDRTG